MKSGKRAFEKKYDIADVKETFDKRGLPIDKLTERINNKRKPK